MAEPTCLVELRVLDGPNRHLAHPAIQLRLDASRLLDAAPLEMAGWCEEVGLRLPVDGAGDGDAHVRAAGAPRSPDRELLARRWLRHVARRLAALDGVESLHVVTGPGHEAGEVVVAFPWSREGRATTLGRWIAWCLEDAGLHPLEETFADAAARLRRARPGPRPTVLDPGVPTVAVTGTNGKTTTTRLIAHIVRAAGLGTAWNATDGIHAAVDGTDGAVQVEAGDWAGFGGAARVLGITGIDVAVLEVARGGILRRGMGVSAVDVGVVTNVSDDHLGDMGVHTLDDLAAVKATVVRAVRPDGWAVLSADDDRVRGMAAMCRGRVLGVGPDPRSPGLVAMAASGACTVTVHDGWISRVAAGEGVAGPATPVIAVADVPMAMGGLSAHNLANALSAVGAAWALGIDDEAIARGLAGFLPDVEDNPGRLNVYVPDGAVGGPVVVVDVAHNVASLRALCVVGRGLVAAGGRLRLVTGTMGDRPEAQIREMGAVSARLADAAVIAEKPAHLRGRDRQVVVDLLNDGAVQAGGAPLAVHPDEITALDAVLADASAGDVVAAAVHDHLGEVAAVLSARGYRPATAAELPSTAAR